MSFTSQIRPVILSEGARSFIASDGVEGSQRLSHPHSCPNLFTHKPVPMTKQPERSRQKGPSGIGEMKIVGILRLRLAQGTRPTFAQDDGVFSSIQHLMKEFVGPGLGPS
jgi:hypothetical protein